MKRCCPPRPTRPRRPAAPDGPPTVKRWQRVIDALLGVSGAAAAPLVAGGERLWLEAVSRPAISRAAARVADLRLPRPLLMRLIEAFVKLYDVDLRDAAEPLDSFVTFNAFFTRRLRPGARPIAADPGVVVCPADARLDRHGPLGPDATIPEVKGRSFTVAELLGDPTTAATYRDGRYAVLYLSPRDYHRVHSPVAATVTAIVAQDGHHYPVNALGARRIPKLLAVNKRVVFHLDSDAFGPIALVMVGATNVGRITTPLAPGDRVASGDELGVFNLGSTVVLLTADPRLAPADVLEGELLRVGQPLLRT